MRQPTCPRIRTARGPSGGWHAHFDGHTTTAGGFRTRSEARAHLLRLAADALEHHQVHLLCCADGSVLTVRWLVDGWTVQECSPRHRVAVPCGWVRHPTLQQAMEVAREEARRRGGVSWESTA